MLLYRSAAWFAKGLREYTKSGYESASKDFVPDDLEVQVPGRSFLVTGGNSGIGKATAIEIAKRGGTVHLVCRDQNRAEGARGEIIRESGNRWPVGASAVETASAHSVGAVRFTASQAGLDPGCVCPHDCPDPCAGERTRLQSGRAKLCALILLFNKLSPSGVRLSMPGFHASMGDRLRSAAQGADTVLWLALAPAATVQPSGL
ncbi:hypothetical protein CB1_000435014 [Camelus ferus]|nr:hypothetical protein CB1_000435014 [Camelus ferus]